MIAERIQNDNLDYPPIPIIWWAVIGYESLGGNIGYTIHGFSLLDERDKEDDFRGLAGRVLDEQETGSRGSLFCLDIDDTRGVCFSDYTRDVGHPGPPGE